MANCNAIPVLDLLGKSVVLTECINGFEFERRGTVVSVIKAVPGRASEEAILLDEPDRETLEYYHVGEFVLHHVC